MKQLIRQIRLVQDNKVEPCSILVDRGQVAGFLPYGAEGTDGCADAVIEGRDRYASHGFVDIHVHGGGGHDFMDGTLEAFLGAAAFHTRYGTTAIAPTTLASTTQELLESFAVYRQAASRPEGASLIGFHVEGPYLSPNQSGAQDRRYIRRPVPEEYEKIVQAGKGVILRWTIAPEVEGAYELADYLAGQGILPAAGHTDATFGQMKEAYKHGFRHITHLYSCCSTIIRQDGYRIAGVTESPYILDGLTVEIIADGRHLPPSLLRMVYRNIGPERTALVTDAMRGAGRDSGKSILGSRRLGQEVIIEDGVAKMPDRRAFAGSVATADRLVDNMVKLAGATLPEAVGMMTQTPARIIGREDTAGVLKAGRSADIILFNEDVHVSFTMLKGRLVWQEENDGTDTNR